MLIARSAGPGGGGAKGELAGARGRRGELRRLDSRAANAALGEA